MWVLINTQMSFQFGVLPIQSQVVLLKPRYALRLFAYDFLKFCYSCKQNLVLGVLH